MFITTTLKNHRLILITALLLDVFYNWAFFKHIYQAYPAFSEHWVFFISLFVLNFALIGLVLSLLCISKATRFVLIFFVLVAAFAAYYMDTFDVIIDKIMIQNMAQTNLKETSDLLTVKLLLYVVALGIVPSIWIYRHKTIQLPLRQAFLSRLLMIALLLVLVASQVLIFSKNYSSFFREQKTVRFYANPLTPIYSAFKFIASQKSGTPVVVEGLGQDARVPNNHTSRDLVVLVVGETARADRFSLNGYNRLTNPLLAQENVVSFKNFTSCGTSTAVSVPCMFSALGRANYSEDKFKTSENVLDVLAHAGVHVLWRDNNSDSKGVAIRNQNVTYQDYKEAPVNTICDIECRDEGMLVGLQDYIDQHPTGDITIVLHQMGSHGPAYYKRYPAPFEQFKPACQSNLLDQCSLAEISNAYDNTILYTDYFLSKVIALLKNNTKKFEASMFYLSDHGESLGENGVYLHGMPYAIAPAAQTHVPAIIWLSNNFPESSVALLKNKENQALSQDNLFHTLLGLSEIQSVEYRADKDILKTP